MLALLCFTDEIKGFKGGAYQLRIFELTFSPCDIYPLGSVFLELHQFSLTESGSIPCTVTYVTLHGAPYLNGNSYSLVTFEFNPKSKLSWQICPICLIFLANLPNLPNSAKIKNPLNVLSLKFEKCMNEIFNATQTNTKNGLNICLFNSLVVF